MEVQQEESKIKKKMMTCQTTEKSESRNRQKKNRLSESQSPYVKQMTLVEEVRIGEGDRRARGTTPHTVPRPNSYIRPARVE